jgi:magnesium chelatase family protein
VTRYQKRISGPLMDRIDIHMQVPRVEFQKLRDMHPASNWDCCRSSAGAVRHDHLSRIP